MSKTRATKWKSALAVCAGAGLGASVAMAGSDLSFDPGTEEDREALFEFLVESTMEWDAFASLPDHPYYQAHPKGIDVRAMMEEYRDELIAADTAEKMWFALIKISNARKDTHLRVSTTSGGLELPEHLNRSDAAPIRFGVDYGDKDNPFFFVNELGDNIEEVADGPVPEVGDRLLVINGFSAEGYTEARRPYHRYSTDNHYRWRLGVEMGRLRDYVPHEKFYGDSMRLTLERQDGTAYYVELPYLDRREFSWQGYSDRNYPGFSRIDEMSDFETYSLYLPDDADLPVVLLQWYGFRRDLPEAMDALMDYAEAHNLLDHHVILDATRSRGGSRGAYAVQRLQSKPFRTTFGNMKVSPAMERWVEDRIERIRRTSEAAETVDGGNWLLDWLETDVRYAIEEGLLYTNDVPFKGAHAPKWADGIIEPAEVHFRGELTVWLNPFSGSHLDQFASQVVDNNLAHVMGMSSGGFSNTWQTTETLRFPTTDKPIVDYQWSMGHSIRPNREILQYNPAEVHEYIPQTRDNFLDYHADLLERTLDRLGLRGPQRGEN